MITRLWTKNGPKRSVDGAGWILRATAIGKKQDAALIFKDNGGELSAHIVNKKRLHE